MGIVQIFNLILIGAFSAAVMCMVIFYRKIKFSKEMLNKKDELWVVFDKGICQDISSDFKRHFLLEKGDDIKIFFEKFSSSSVKKLMHAYENMNKETNFFVYDCETKESGSYRCEMRLINKKYVMFLSKISSQAPQIIQKQQEAFTHILKAIPGVIWQQKENVTLLTDFNQNNALQNDQVDLMLKSLHEPRFRKLSKQALKLGVMQQEDFVISTTGKKQYFRVYQQPMEDLQSTIGFAYDITSFKEKEKKWQKSTQVYGQALNHLSMAVALFSSEGCLCYFNKAYVKLYNFDMTWLKSKPHINEILEEMRHLRQWPEYVDFNEYKRECVNALSSVEGFQEELLHLPDGRTLRLIKTSYPLGGLLVLLEDITQQLVLERSNKSLLASHYTSLTNLFEGILMISDDYRIKLANPSFTELWQLDDKMNLKQMHAHEIFEKMRDLFISDLHWKRHRQELIANISERRAGKGFMTHKEGFDIQFTYTPLPNGDHLIMYLAEKQQDITGIKNFAAI